MQYAPLPSAKIQWACNNYVREELAEGGSCDIWVTTFDMESGQVKSCKKRAHRALFEGGGSRRGS